MLDNKGKLRGLGSNKIKKQVEPKLAVLGIGKIYLIQGHRRFSHN